MKNVSSGDEDDLRILEFANGDLAIAHSDNSIGPVIAANVCNRHWSWLYMFSNNNDKHQYHDDRQW